MSYRLRKSLIPVKNKDRTNRGTWKYKKGYYSFIENHIIELSEVVYIRETNLYLYENYYERNPKNSK